MSYAIFSVLQNYSYKSVLSNKGIPCVAKNPCCFISREMKLNNAYFKGIVRALREYQQKLIEGNVSVYVRRAGPNYQEGLRIMRELGL